MYKFIQTVIVFLCLSCVVFAQSNKNTALVVGRVVAKDTKAPITDLQVSINKLKMVTSTGSQGEFVLSEVPFGTYHVLVSGGGIATDSFVILVNKDIDMGFVGVNVVTNATTATTPDIPTIGIEENNVSTDDDNAQVQTGGGLIGSSRDPFVFTSTFILNLNHWYPRAYPRGEEEVLINGVTMNDVSNGVAAWGRWGGLNDVFHSRDKVYGLNPADNTFGGLIGSISFNATAADQRKETKVTYSITDRNYRNRIMLTHNSGLMKNGWAYSISVSKRWAQEGYVPGTFYDGYAYYAAVSKVVKKSTFSFTTFGAPTRRGKSTFITKEEAQLAGTNYYNPNWGYQNGEKRNARIADEFQPVMMLTHNYKPNERTIWTTTLAYQFGKVKNSGFDWYQSYDPRPDYYKNLPSYQLNSDPVNVQGAIAITDSILADRNRLQVDWKRIYNNNYINHDSVTNANGITGNTVRGRRSTVVLANDVQDIKKWTFNTNLQHALDEHITFYTGLEVVAQKTQNYRQLLDLLGGDYFTNYNQFAAQQYVGNLNYAQNDLNHPNQVVRVGDIYGYNYSNNYLNAAYRAQVKFNYNKYDFFVAGFAGSNSFNRDGQMRNGLFANSSYGTSATQSFIVYGLKGGADYKINGYNMFYVNAELRADPPSPDNTYISQRTRDYTIDNPTVEISKSIEGGYMLRRPNVSARVSGYATDITNATLIKRFYNDDPAYQTFVNYVMTDVNMHFVGTELAAEFKLTKALTATGVISVGQAFYSDRPTIKVYRDNDTVKNPTASQAYIKNYYLGSGPQSAYSLGFNYRQFRKWSARINFSYYDRNYVDVNPDRRTTEAAGAVKSGTAAWHQIFDQEKLPSYFIVDLGGTYDVKLKSLSKGLPNSTDLYLSFSINNLLNNTNVISSGFEQLRYDFSDSNPAKFPNKYLYGSGINFVVSAALKL